MTDPLGQSESLQFGPQFEESEVFLSIEVSALISTFVPAIPCAKTFIFSLIFPELLTTFSPGPVVVTQVTSGRSSIRSSPLPRRSSTRSAPGGTSPRRHRPRTPSVRGGPVHVVEVESDSITTPRVEIESPSKSLASIRMSLRGDTSEVRHSPTLSLPCDPLQPPETNAPNEMSSQSLLQTDFQLHPASSPHLSPQTYVPSPIQAVVLPQPLVVDPAHPVQLHAESPINTVSYTTPQTLPPSNMYAAATPHPYSTAPQICTAPQVHVVAAGAHALSPAPPDIITSQAPMTTTMMMMSRPFPNAPQIHIESEDHLLPHMQEAAPPQGLIRVHEPLMNPKVAQQQQQVALEASAAIHSDGEVTATALQHYPTTTTTTTAAAATPVTKQRSSPDTGLIKFYPTFRYICCSLSIIN
ncbi:proline-rich protein 36-like [Macrobrachium rosenbergii]|uniref:proline-rich protein 36-like n=1 Tax=Macrobrachium rosenbergii TaxID=79674 RepID=UPI0034D6BD4C